MKFLEFDIGLHTKNDECTVARTRGNICPSYLLLTNMKWVHKYLFLIVFLAGLASSLICDKYRVNAISVYNARRFNVCFAASSKLFQLDRNQSGAFVGMCDLGDYPN